MTPGVAAKAAETPPVRESPVVTAASEGPQSVATAPPLTAVAMSGGLDSSVAALLLKQQGVPVVGLSMLLWDRSQQVRHRSLLRFA